MKPALTLIAALAPLAALAQEQDCRSARDAAAAQTRIDETLQAVARDPGDRQARLAAALKARADARGWSSGRQEALLKQVTSSPEFTAFENEKLPHVTALSRAVMSSSGPDARATKCQAAREVDALAREISAVNARQYRHAAAEIDRATEAAR